MPVNVYAARKAVDGCGAGATFSAGFIYGYLNGWDLEQSARFATAAASLKVTRGLANVPVDEIQALASRLRVQHLKFQDNQFHKITGMISARQQKLVHEGQKLAKMATDRLLPKRKPKVKAVHEASEEETLLDIVANPAALRGSLLRRVIQTMSFAELLPVNRWNVYMMPRSRFCRRSV